jgi:hypothetical protein
MIGAFSTKFAAAARRAGLAAVLGVAAAATVVGFAGAAHASPSPFVPNADRGGMPVLVAHYGIRSSAEKEISTSELERALGRGDKVIALLNSETIWNDPPSRGQRTDADHAVVVTGIDTKAGVVHLNDSGIDTGKDEQVSIATFEQAWATSTKDRKPGSGDVFQVPASEFRF